MPTYEWLRKGIILIEIYLWFIRLLSLYNEDIMKCGLYRKFRQSLGNFIKLNNGAYKNVEFLNVLVTDCNPIKNLDYKAGLPSIFFISLVFIVSIFSYGVRWHHLELIDNKRILPSFTRLFPWPFYSSISLIPKPLQSFRPALTYLHFELLFWGSIFFGEHPLLHIFMIFIILSLS